MLWRLKLDFRLIDKKLVKFIFTGVVNTIFSYLIFVVIFFLTGQKEVTLTISFIIGILFNYYTISSYVFESTHNNKKIRYFFLVYLLLYMLNLIHLFITVNLFNFDVYLSQLITLIYLPLLSFYLNKKYVFTENN
jgi:putative flippase GtrA